jgi:enamine deaminase RidA (YjgF/YER057c/UK114 family)
MYASTPDYAHSRELVAPRRFVFVSGTMGLDEQGVAPPTLTEQLVLVWDNLRAILRTHDMTLEHVVRVTSYLRDAAYAVPNAKARLDALDGRLVPTTAIVVATLSPEWLVEIEVIAAD